MDIHRSRFVPYPSSAINALAFSHAEPEHGQQQDPESLRLAIGRANGNIELWNPNNGTWLQEKVFYGGKERSVEGLAWTQEPDQKNSNNKIVSGRPRLFSVGYSSSVTEWDLTTGLPTQHSNGNHSEVWCFAVQPHQKKNPGSNSTDTCQKIVAGCADGTIVLLSTEDSDLTFDRFVSRATNKKARALSITYKDRDIVLAGFADSTIRVFDTRNGNVIRNISLGSGPTGGPKEILVWKVKCLASGDFVSGDSTGEIRIYDGKRYSQQQRIAGHEADILDLAVSRDGNSIFSAGMDRRTCVYARQRSASKIEGHSGKWRKVSHQRYHAHDVKAMATYEGHNLSIVVSGGIDTQPIVVPIREFGRTLNRGLPSLPASPPLVSAPHARLLVSWWNTEVRIWRVKPSNDGNEKPKVVARLALQGEENVTSVSISEDGQLLVVSSISAVKIFQLMPSEPGSGSALRVRKLDMSSMSGARLVRLTADGKWLSIVNPTNEVRVARIVRSEDPEDAPRVLASMHQLHRLPRDNLPHSTLSGSSGEYERSITHMDFSADGKIFAVADLAGYVDTWVLEGNEDTTAPETDIDDSAQVERSPEENEDEDEAEVSQFIFLGQRWIKNPSSHQLPRLDSVPVLLSFQPTQNESARPQPNGNPAVHPTRHNPHPHSHEIPHTEHRLLLVSADHKIYLVNVMEGRLAEWSRRNPPLSYPREYRQLDLPAKGCIWDISKGQERLWLYGEKWLFMFNLTKDFPIFESDASGPSKKRKRDAQKDVFRKSAGAGDVISSQDASVTRLRKFDGKAEDSITKTKWIDINAVQPVDADEEEDNGQSLARLRRSNTDGEVQTNGEDMELTTVGEISEAQKKSAISWWHTFKYRPILGILPVSSDLEQSPEVVLVERPSWDLDLPPRFIGAHEH